MLKQCPKCEKIKDVSEFYKDVATKTGLSSYCKECANRNQKKEVQARYRCSEKGKVKDRRYAKSDKGKVVIGKSKRKYRTTEHGKQVEAAHHAAYDKTIEGMLVRKRYIENNKEKVIARYKVKLAVLRGDLPNVKILKCSCGKWAVHYHHYLGYEKEHRLDVIPQCKKCHNS